MRTMMRMTLRMTMRMTLSKWLRRRGMLAASLASLCALASAPAQAIPIPVEFLQVGTAPTGFDPNGFPLPVDFTLPLAADIRPVGMGTLSDAFGISLSTCFIIDESPGAGCQTLQPFGSQGYTLIVSMTLLSAPDDAQGQDSLIFFTALPPVPTYSVSQVSVVIDPDPVPGQSFVFTPFSTTSYTFGPSMTYYYLGFFLGVGETATFLVDVTGDHSSAGSPLVFAANGWVVPEPSTALLLGTGLALLARRRSR